MDAAEARITGGSTVCIDRPGRGRSSGRFKAPGPPGTRV